MMREQTYRIRVGTVAFQTADGWSTARQVPGFEVQATSFGEAARKAQTVMLAGSDPKSGAHACFGMLDEADNYASETAAEETTR